LIENYPGFHEGIDGFSLAEKMQAGAELFGAQTEYSEVKDIEFSGQTKRLHTSSGDFESPVVILATGASPKKLGLPGEEELVGRGVAYCASCDGMYYKGKSVAVVGGGNSACSDALTLSKLCSKVTVIHRRDTLRAEKAYQEPLRRAENIEFIWNAQVERLLFDKTLTGLALRDKITGRSFELSCDGMFIAIGRTPNTALAAGKLDLDAYGYIVADETTRTNFPGVLAVGDVRTKPLRQIVTAASDRAVASVYAQDYLAAGSIS
jgi:thioredoxin reductase (NADPH)